MLVTTLGRAQFAIGRTSAAPNKTTRWFGKLKVNKKRESDRENGIKEREVNDSDCYQVNKIRMAESLFFWIPNHQKGHFQGRGGFPQDFALSLGISKENMTEGNLYRSKKGTLHTSINGRCWEWKYISTAFTSVCIKLKVKEGGWGY